MRKYYPGEPAITVILHLATKLGILLIINKQYTYVLRLSTSEHISGHAMIECTHQTLFLILIHSCTRCQEIKYFSQNKMSLCDLYNNSDICYLTGNHQCWIEMTVWQLTLQDWEVFINPIHPYQLNQWLYISKQVLFATFWWRLLNVIIMCIPLLLVCCTQVCIDVRWCEYWGVTWQA